MIASIRKKERITSYYRTTSHHGDSSRPLERQHQYLERLDKSNAGMRFKTYPQIYHSGWKQPFIRKKVKK
jgi:hypothetical protein